MNLFQLLNVEENPLPLSVLIYLVITGLIIRYKPKMIFDDEESNEYNPKDNSHKIWIFFIMLAVVTYVGVSVYSSTRIRETYCNKLLSSDIQKLLKKSGCK